MERGPPDGSVPDARRTDRLPETVPGQARYVQIGRRQFHVVEAGPSNGDLVVLLHGFPEFWYGWHEQVAPLAEAGYRVVVPDLRGCNRSAAPDSVSAYRIGRLADDVSGLIQAYGRESAAVVGHDWGGVIGWWLAIHESSVVDRLLAVNAPHPTVIRQTLREDPAQVARTSYAFAFQLPVVPEAVAGAFDWRLPTEMLRRTSLPGTFDEGDFDRYRGAWNRSFSTMLDWYRANGRSRPKPETNVVTVPIRVVWGARDQFLDNRMAFDSLNHCADSRLTMLDDATHWLHHEFPGRLTDVIKEELTV